MPSQKEESIWHLALFAQRFCLTGISEDTESM